jgi:hypothetical protein
MKLSSQTIEILKNFSNINQNIWVDTGSVLKTIAPGQNIFAIAKIPEAIPAGFGIYDLPRFISTLNFFKDPEIEFTSSNSICIREGKKIYTYHTSPRNILSVLDKSIKEPEFDTGFTLDKLQLQEMLKVSSGTQLPHITFEGDSKNIKIVVHDKDDKSSNKFEVEVGTTDQEFSMTFDRENFVMMHQSYDVMIRTKGIVKFEQKDYNTSYYITPLRK